MKRGETIGMVTVTILAVLAFVTASPAVASGGEKGDVEIGLYGGYVFPDTYGAGASALNPDDDVLYGVRFGVFFTPGWSLELSGQRFSSETATASVADFDVDSVRLNLLRNFRPGQKFRPFVTFGAGNQKTEVGTTIEENGIAYNVGAGARWFLTDTFGVRLDSRFISTHVTGAVNERQEDYEGTFGVLWAFGGKKPGDSDGDGVVDRRDKCPGTPRGAVVDEKGCPVDTDGDGVPDGIDKCPDTKKGVPVDTSGCAKDSDKDGVHDGNDRCPDTPRGAKVDARGCPMDSDGDGVYDGLDKCPDTPKGAIVDSSGCRKDSDGDGVPDGIDQCGDTPRGATVDTKGCPMDSDGDGVWDGLDKCPGTPKGAKVDSKGCEVLFEDKRRTLVLEGVNFEFNSAKLTLNATSILDRVAMSLNEWKEIRVEVAGHTDSVGDDRYNQTLSKRRAEAVRAYLVSKGVDGSRMTARGYGESKPVADNATRAGRTKNRRVELKKLD